MIYLRAYLAGWLEALVLILTPHQSYRMLQSGGSVWWASILMTLAIMFGSLFMALFGVLVTPQEQLQLDQMKKALKSGISFKMHTKE